MDKDYWIINPKGAKFRIAGYLEDVTVMPDFNETDIFVFIADEDYDMDGKTDVDYPGFDDIFYNHMEGVFTVDTREGKLKSIDEVREYLTSIGMEETDSLDLGEGVKFKDKL